MEPGAARANTTTAGAQLAPDVLMDLLCRHLVVDRAYAVLAVPDGEGVRPHGVTSTDGFEWQLARLPELLPLTEHFDRILVRSDGYSFEVVCIKNRLADPSRRVTLSLDALREMGRPCLKYTGKVQGTKLPVIIRVWEVCSEAASDVDHLRSLRCMPGGQKVGVTSWSLRPASRTVWTNARWNGLLAGRKHLESLLARLGSGAAPGTRTDVEVGADVRVPVLTYALVSAMAVIYVLQLVLGEFHGLLSPTVESLLASGGLHRALILESGQWYRIVSAAFLHGDVSHVVLNGIALFLGGAVLESLVGRSWLLTIFGASVLGGAGASLLLNDPQTVSVGASGAIMGMLAAAFLVTYRLPYGQERTSAQMQLLYWLVPALIPLAIHRSGGKIDFAAHFGGTVVGFALGGFILKSWRVTDRLPRFGRVASVLAVAFVLLFGASLGQAFSKRTAIQQELDLANQLGPDEQLQKLRSAPADQLEKLIGDLRTRFPRDPRVGYFSALAVLEKNADDAEPEAERHLKQGLSEQAVLRSLFNDGRLESAMRILLARLQLRRGADPEARDTLRPACATLRGQAPAGLTADWVASVCAP